MRIVKLDAIPSTNDFLKDMVRNSVATNFTVVTAKSQTNGKGQRGSVWESEVGKNLTFSIFINETKHFADGVFSMNVAVAVSIFKTLQKFNVPHLSIKWPNDILSDNKKLGGILIENILHANGNFSSVIGIGLNVNQKDFSALPAASSIANILGAQVDMTDLFSQLLNELRIQLSPEANGANQWECFRENLFRRDLISSFVLSDGTELKATIEDIDHKGRLLIRDSNNQLKKFLLKEITLIY